MLSSVSSDYLTEKENMHCKASPVSDYNMHLSQNTNVA